MRKGFLVLLLALFWAEAVRAQKEPMPVSTAAMQPEFLTPPLASPSAPDDGAPQTTLPATAKRIWGDIDGLLWWFKGSPLPAPLVTTGNPNDGALAGTLASANTRVLFGGSSQQPLMVPGGRFTLGGWLTPEPFLGIEVTGFFLERDRMPFQAASDSGGNPPLYLPAFNVLTHKEDSAIIADPVQQFSGNVAVSTTSRLFGAEVNGVFAGWSTPSYQVQMLAGFRYLDLQEGLQIDSTSSDLAHDSQLVLSDSFTTRNQFYGGQIGARLYFVRDRFSAVVTGKLALGGTCAAVTINGSATQMGSASSVTGTFPGGFFTQPSNLGRTTRDDFSLVPEAQVKLGYEILRGCRAFVGYDLLYWTQVVRPGSQVDRNLNLTQSPVFGTGTLAGPAQPAPFFNRSDFWAQGLMFGFEFRY